MLPEKELNETTLDVKKGSTANAEDQTPIPWSSSPHPMRCTLMLSTVLYSIRLILLQQSVVSQVDSMAPLTPFLK
jgi:hypothetical protein